MNKGDIYYWERGYPDNYPEYEDFRNRHFEILAISKTHVYIRNLRLRNRANVPISTFKKNYVKSPMFGRK